MLLAALALLRGPLLAATAGFETDEPLEFGVLPAHLLEGLMAPLWAYRTQPNEGGSLIWGLWVAPWFAALGPSYRTLRIAGLAWHGLTMLGFCALAKRAAGDRAAWTLGALWVVAPPGIVWLSSRGWANHLEATALVMLALWGATGRGRLAAVVAGAAVPLAAFFQLSAAAQGLAAAVFAAVAVLRGRLPWRWWLLGTGLGAAPLVAGLLGALSGWIGEQGPAADLELVRRSLQLLTHDLAGLGSFRDDVPLVGPRVPGGLAWGRAWLAAGLGLMALGATRLRRLEAPEVVVAAGWVLAAHTAAALLSGRDLGEFRYLAPLWHYALLLASVARGRAAGVLLALALLLPLRHHAATLGEVEFARLQAEGGLRGGDVRTHEALAERIRGASAAEVAAWARRSEATTILALAGEGSAGDAAAGAAASEATASIPSDPPAASPAARLALAEGAGAAIIKDRVHELGVGGALAALGPPGRPGTTAFARRLGAGQELGRQLIVTDAADLPPVPDLGVCVGLGIWAVQGRRRSPELHRVCPAEPVAVGRGIGAARASLPGAEAPPLRYWLDRPAERPITPAEEFAYRCGYAQTGVEGAGLAACFGG